MTREIELKLEVDQDNLPLLRQEPFLASAESHSNHQVTVYYDTPETRLKKHGFTLRVRSSGGRFVQTVKPITGNIGLFSREEVECEVPSIEPDLSSLSEHPLYALLDGGESNRLEPQIRCDVTRTSWQLDRRNGRMRVDLDDGTIIAGERSHDFAELELELIDGAPESLIVAARRLSDHVPLRLGVLTKAERGFLLSKGALGKISKAGPVAVHDGMTVAEAFEMIVHDCLKHYRLNEPLVVRDCKAAALHQARVAMRRLRSAFSLFRPAIEDVEFQHLRHEVRWFTAQLGDARNLDVYLERDLDDDERALVTKQREKAYVGVADAINSHKFRRLLVDLVGWTAIGSWRSGKLALRPVSAFAGGRLDKLWHSIASAGRDVAHMDESTRHGLRIQVKKVRYATEFLSRIYSHAPGAGKRFGAAVEDLQESLGKLNDLSTARGISSGPAEDSWLIGSFEERRHLIAAETAYRELLNVGAFWRATSPERPPGGSRQAHAEGAAGSARKAPRKSPAR